MAGRSVRPLLADVSPILLVPIFLALVFVTLQLVAPTFLRGQDESAERQVLSDGITLAPTLGTARHALPLAPLPPPRVPLRPAVSPDATNLQRMVQAAGIIFSGRVTFVGRASPSTGQSPPATNISFRVEHAMRGTSDGQSLTIREWAGLWTSGERYRIGEHVLLFLYPPSKLGFTSPVSGSMGRFAVDPQDRVILGARHAESLAAHPILGGKARVPYRDFAAAVHGASGEALREE
jgi:hypothetical protein